MPHRTTRLALALIPAALLLPACSDGGSTTPSTGEPTTSAAEDAPPVPYLERVDHLIQPGETRFAALYKITAGGENAEAYWSYAGDRLVLQRRDLSQGIACDRIYVTESEGGLRQVSDGRGVTTCAYFLPGDTTLVYASTTAEQEGCPPPPSMARGYVWALRPEYEIYAHDLVTGEVRALTDAPGYDAEATVSPTGDRIVFTSTRSGDVELWTMAPDGSDLVQVTDEPGYDGGAFFSHDGTRLVFRATEFSAEGRERELADYRSLLEQGLVRPSRMELYTCALDGSDRRKVTELGRANFAPYFTPDDSAILFASNHHNPTDRDRNFDLFLVPAEGGPHGAEAAERVTTYDGFDSFPMFSPDGRWLAFASNRGGSVEGETNVFVARWKD